MQICYHWTVDYNETWLLLQANDGKNNRRRKTGRKDGKNASKDDEAQKITTERKPSWETCGRKKTWKEKKAKNNTLTKDWKKDMANAYILFFYLLLPLHFQPAIAIITNFEDTKSWLQYLLLNPKQRTMDKLSVSMQGNSGFTR